MRMTGGVIIGVLAVASACSGDDWVARLQGEWWGGAEGMGVDYVLHITGTNVIWHSAVPYGRNVYTASCSSVKADGSLQLDFEKIDDGNRAIPPMPIYLHDDDSLTIMEWKTRRAKESRPVQFHKIDTNPASNVFEGSWTQQDHPQAVLNVFSNGQGVIAWNGYGTGKMVWALSNGQAVVTALEPRVQGCPALFKCSILNTNILIGTAKGGEPRLFKKIPDPRKP
jgi:hypothetical protein